MDSTAADFFLATLVDLHSTPVSRWPVTRFEACELVDLIDTFDGSALDVILFSDHARFEEIILSHQHHLLDSVLQIVSDHVEDTYMLSKKAPLHHHVTCSELPHVTCVSRDTVTCVTCHFHARTLSLTVAN